ncbi:ricin-type beta-trefoil lectin domain protein [Lolliginicoccus levis]|uniref:ricin-type beta-trefoil lectin domain protein n=1 Tax=Lolliginicoccus levis TaxID=2919542 RepID=UPI00241E0B9C|nr:ricin-type beta-trefoil lectin domain protein [Lolliginicoccus levis]
MDNPDRLHPSRARRAPILLAALVMASSATLAAAPSSAQTQDALSYVQNHNGRCIDNAQAKAVIGNPIQLYDCNQTNAQEIATYTDGTARIQGFCVGPKDGSKWANAALVLHDCTNARYLKWDVAGDGTIRNRASKLCVDNSGARDTNGNPIVQYTCNGTNAQEWTIIPVGSLDPGEPSEPDEPEEPPVSSPSGVPVPRGDLPGWRQIFLDDFTKDAAVGTWANECEPDKIVYTGAEGQKWRTYPKCYLDTYHKRPYRPDEVLSVQDGVLNFHLHTVDGQLAGANPSPLIDGNQQYQTYGRYTARFKVDSPSMSDYHIAWLLWPQSEKWPEDGEFDFPEGNAAGEIGGFHHWSGAGACADGCQESAIQTGKTFTEWHTFTMEWTPGRIRYILDDQVVLDSTEWVPSGPMRWQLQTETIGTGNSSGNLLVDWVSVYSYNP